MKNQVVLLLILVVLVSLVIHAAPLVKADTTIYIRPDGSIIGTNLIARKGNTYTFTANITAPIHVERGGVIVDGAGYTLEGHKVGDGLNLTCSNSTIKNLRIADWNTAIFGAYHNNAIIGNIIINCEYGIKIYANSYQIIENTIMDCDNSIFLHGGDHLITRNNITRNGIGVYIRGYASYLKNTVIENTFTRNINAIALIQSTTCQKIYHNNFINNKHPNNSYTIYGRPYNLITTRTTDANGNIIENVTKKYYDYPTQPTIPPQTWDNGTTGNYYSDYNGTDVNGDGIGDTPYITLSNSTDCYPLMNPVLFEGATATEPSPLPTQIPQATPTPTLTSTTTLTQSPILTATPLTEPAQTSETTPTVPAEIYLATLIIFVAVAAGIAAFKKHSSKSEKA